MYIRYLMFCCLLEIIVFFFFKQKTAYEMRISDWSSDGCSSDLLIPKRLFGRECTFPVSLERPGDQAVIRVDRFVTTAHERRLVAGAFQAQLPLLMKLLTFEFDILGRLQAHIDCRRRQRFKDQRRNRKSVV